MPAINLTPWHAQMFADNSWTTDNGDTYVYTITTTFDNNMRIVQCEPCGFTASFDTQMLSQEQMVSQDVYAGTIEPNDWSLQGLSPCYQFSVSISGTESLGEEVSDEGKTDGVSTDQETHPVVEETPRNSPDKTKKRNLLEEAKELEKRRARSALLDDIDERYCRVTTAKFLESQRLFNELPKTGNHWLDK